jgi:hypothetical protein
MLLPPHGIVVKVLICYAFVAEDVAIVVVPFCFALVAEVVVVPFCFGLVAEVVVVPICF